MDITFPQCYCMTIKDIIILQRCGQEDKKCKNVNILDTEISPCKPTSSTTIIPFSSFTKNAMKFIKEKKHTKQTNLFPLDNNESLIDLFLFFTFFSILTFTQEIESS